MKFHEKTLELNITHELLNLADSFSWYLTDIGLWQYWKPGYNHLTPFKFKKSVAYGLHSSVEGKDDDTGDAGGGYDVKIKCGQNDSVLFIQYKKGEYKTKKPNNHDGTESIFMDGEKHFVFKINSEKTNQHFTLSALSQKITDQNGNAVLYAFPLIKDIEDLENHGGEIVKRTKFISIDDLDKEAKEKVGGFTKGKIHNYRIASLDMSKSEINYYYYYYGGPNKSEKVIIDTIILGFIKTLEQLKNSGKLKKEDKTNFREFLVDATSNYHKYLRNKLDLFLPPHSINGSSIIFEIDKYLNEIINWLQTKENFNLDGMPEYNSDCYTQGVELDIDFKDESKYMDSVTMIKI